MKSEEKKAIYFSRLLFLISYRLLSFFAWEENKVNKESPTAGGKR
jgi:uncharacterized membrane protein